MKSHIYITRHGESVWNVECKVQGATDTRLNLSKLPFTRGKKCL